MDHYLSRQYENRDMATLLRFASEATAVRLPGLTYWNPGDVAWQLGMFPPGADLSGHVRMWEGASGVVALAIFEPPLHFAFDLHPRLGLDTSLADDVLSWVEQRRRGIVVGGGAVPVAYQMLGESTLSTEVLESDAARISFLEIRGYVRVERHSVRYSRDLDEPVGLAALPKGMRFRHVTDDDIEARAELHRDAWSVWGASSFSESRYRRLRANPVYDQTLDIVLESADGNLLSYCICWFDRENGIGHFEPVGTRPAFAGQGLGRALVMEGLRRLKERGAHTALIGTASVNEPALRTYAACGFKLVERQYYYSRLIGP